MHTEAINHDPGGHVLPDRIAAGRPAVDRRVAVLRARLREREPARRSSCCCRARASGDQPLYSWLWGSGFLPSQHQGVQFRARQGPGALPGRSRRPRSRPAAGGCSTRCARSRQQQHARVHGSGDRRAHRAVRDGLPHADGGARGDGPRRRAATRVFDMYGARRAQARAPTPPTACWRGAWPSATCASSSSITRAGTSTATCPRTSRSMTKSVDQASAALVVDLEAARPARGHAGHLGRRVRPHQLLAGQARRRTTTAATTIRAASRSGWPAAA